MTPDLIPDPVLILKFSIALSTGLLKRCDPLPDTLGAVSLFPGLDNLIDRNIRSGSVIGYIFHK